MVRILLKRVIMGYGWIEEQPRDTKDCQGSRQRNLPPLEKGVVEYKPGEGRLIPTHLHTVTLQQLV